MAHEKNAARDVRSAIAGALWHADELRSRGAERAGGWESLQGWHAKMLDEVGAARRSLARSRRKGLRDSIYELELAWVCVVEARRFPMSGGRKFARLP